jgi:catechol 2,3-dioxygenase-like lactoylglutathione lyase family enzyme
MDASTELATQIKPIIDPRTGLGHVHLVAADLDREIAFYRVALGLQLHWREGNRAGLGSGGGDLLRLRYCAARAGYGARRASTTSPCCCPAGWSWRG